MRPACWWPVVLVAAALAVTPAGADHVGVEDDLSAATLIRRVGEYLGGFAPAYAPVVAEEHYTQTLRPKRATIGVTRTETRVILTDVVVVSDTAGTWLNFRDVYAVDRRPVRDRDERLARLFFAAPGVGADVLARAGAIADESARFNLGTLSRNVNVPAMALNFLTPDRIGGLTIRRGRRERVNGVETITL